MKIDYHMCPTCGDIVPPKPTRLRSLRCALFGHRDQIIYRDGRMNCGFCGALLVSRALKGDVTIHVGDIE